MKRRLCYALFVLTSSLASAAVYAAQCKGIAFPEQLQSDGATLQLNGLGLRQATFLKVNVYVAALYVAQKSGDADSIVATQSPKELVLHFVRDVDRADLNKAWDEGFEKNAPHQVSALRERIDSFKGMMSDMQEGQRLRLNYRPDAGVRVDVNGASKGTVAGDDFAQALFSIWLGPNPPNAGLKVGLLGGGCG